MNAATKNATVPVEDLKRMLAVWERLAVQHTNRAVAEAYATCAVEVRELIEAAS